MEPATDLLFDFEDTDDGAGIQKEASKPMSSELEALAHKLEMAARQPSELARQLHRDVTSILEEPGLRSNMTTFLSALAAKLSGRGYDVSIRVALGGGSECFRSLRHEFLVVRGTGEYTGMEFIVEPALRQHFTIPHPSPDYTYVLSRAPDVYVGGSCRLVPIVQLLCALMADSFQRQGLALPPWRKEAAMLSKWLPSPARVRDISACAALGNSHTSPFLCPIDGAFAHQASLHQRSSSQLPPGALEAHHQSEPPAVGSLSAPGSGGPSSPVFCQLPVAFASSRGFVAPPTASAASCYRGPVVAVTGFHMTGLPDDMPRSCDFDCASPSGCRSLETGSVLASSGSPARDAGAFWAHHPRAARRPRWTHIRTPPHDTTTTTAAQPPALACYPAGAPAAGGGAGLLAAKLLLDCAAVSAWTSSGGSRMETRPSAHPQAPAIHLVRLGGGPPQPQQLHELVGERSWLPWRLPQH